MWWNTPAPNPSGVVHTPAPGAHADWKVNIHPTQEELDAMSASLSRSREYLAECLAIAEELFPGAEEERKPPANPTQGQQRWHA